MKKTRKAVGILLTIAMVLSLVCGVFAAETTKTGTITITTDAKGHTYTVYRIFDLESYNSTTGSYSYKVNNEWADFAKEMTDYVSVDAQGYVTFKSNEGFGDGTFAQKAIEYAKEEGSKVDKTATTKTMSKETEDKTLVFGDLKLGYYIIDSSVGAIRTLTNLDSDKELNEKNPLPTVEKKVKEDSAAENSYGKENDADIGQTVEFKTTINVSGGKDNEKGGALNYVLHDKMSTGLEFDVNSVVIKMNETVVSEENYDLITTGLTDGCTFEIVFKNAFTKTIVNGTQIEVTYKATLTPDAEIGGTNPNTNETWLKYGQETTGETTHEQTKTYTWEVNVFKYTGNNEALAGAEFVVYKEVKETVEGEEKQVKYYAQFDTNNKITGWTKNQDEATTLTSDANGKINLQGLDADIYYLDETKAPSGYNRLAAPIYFQIKKDIEAEVKIGNVYLENADKPEADKTINVENKTNSGGNIPSTGGVGTTIFRVLGSILVIGAAVLLITRKRLDITERR